MADATKDQGGAARKSSCSSHFGLSAAWSSYYLWASYLDLIFFHYLVVCSCKYARFAQQLVRQCGFLAGSHICWFLSRSSDCVFKSESRGSFLFFFSFSFCCQKVWMQPVWWIFDLWSTDVLLLTWWNTGHFLVLLADVRTEQSLCSETSGGDSAAEGSLFPLSC